MKIVKTFTAAIDKMTPLDMFVAVFINGSLIFGCLFITIGGLILGSVRFTLLGLILDYLTIGLTWDIVKEIAHDNRTN